MADFIAKLGLDSSAFVAGMEAAAQKTGSVTAGMDQISSGTSKAGAAMTTAGNQGASAFAGLKGKLDSLGSSFSDVGKSALTLFGGGLLVGGVQSLVGGLDDLIKKGIAVKQTQNEIKAAFAGSGLEGKKLEESLKQNAKNVEDLSFKYAVSKGVINDSTKAFINFGGKSTDLAKTQEQLIVLQQRFGLSEEAAGKLLGKATDPENEASLKRLGIVFDKNATEAERQQKIQEKLADSMAILKEQADGPVGAMNRFKNSLGGFAGAIASSLIDTLAPVLTTLSVAAEFVVKNVLPALKNGIAILKDVISPVIDAIKEGFIITFQTVFTIVQPIITGLYNAFVNIKNAIFPATESTGSLKDLFVTLSPIISAITIGLTAYYGIMGLLRAQTIITTAAKTAYAAITTTVTALTSGQTAAQLALNAAFIANPIGITIAAIAALVAGLVVAYQRSETFRNIINSLWENVKKAAASFIELFVRFNPIINLFKLAYDNIAPFRQAVDYVIVQVSKLWEGIKNVASAIGGFFSSAGQAPEAPKKKEEAKPVQIKAEETKDTKTEADKEEAAKKADERSKKALDNVKQSLGVKIQELEAETKLTNQKIEQAAIDQNRKLTDEERAQILRNQLELNESIKKATKDAFKVTGEGANLRVGVKGLTKEDMATARGIALNELGKLSDEKVKIGFELVKLGDEGKKQAADSIKQSVKDLESSAKDSLTVELFAKMDEAAATAAVVEKVKAVRAKANQATALGFTELAAQITKEANDLESSLTDVARKGQEQRRKQAEEDRKKDLEIKIQSIDNERARAVAKQIVELDEKRKEILRSDRGTAEERLAIAKRYEKEIQELAKGTDESIKNRREKLAQEERDLTKSLSLRKVSYEEYTKRIAAIKAESKTIDEEVKDIQEGVKKIQDVVEPLKNDEKATRITFTLDKDGLDKAIDESAKMFDRMIAQGITAKDAIVETFKSMNGALANTFKDTADTAIKSLDFKGTGVVNNIESIGTAFAASFASAETSGQNFGDSIQSGLNVVNQGVSGELTTIAKEQDDSFEGLATSAGASFAAMVVSGQNAGAALKDVSKGVVGKLIDMYVAPVILSTLAFLGPFALPVATALVAGAKSLFASAISGFEEGGYTGNKGTSDIAGVVHGQEFVHTAGVTRRYRPLFEHLHKGGELSTWAIGVTGQLQTQNQPQPFVSTYGIETRLERLETAIVRGNRKFESMRAVQMTVEHDPSLIIKSQARNLEVRSARA